MGAHQLDGAPTSHGTTQALPLLDDVIGTGMQKATMEPLATKMHGATGTTARATIDLLAALEESTIWTRSDAIRDRFARRALLSAACNGRRSYSRGHTADGPHSPDTLRQIAAQEQHFVVVDIRRRGCVVATRRSARSSSFYRYRYRYRFRYRYRW